MVEELFASVGFSILMGHNSLLPGIGSRFDGMGDVAKGK
jgi:hypothetical protein